MAPAYELLPDYWANLQIGTQDLEALQTHLLEVETPLTLQDLMPVLITSRLKAEQQAREQKGQSAGRTYLPSEHYAAGQRLVFPALDWRTGTVLSTRLGVNPEIGTFDVITVDLEGGGQRMFAASLAAHGLNEQADPGADLPGGGMDDVIEEYGPLIQQKLETALAADPGLVRIAGRWFPRGLLVDINEGHLNLAEAVLDMAQGEPQLTAALLKDIELPAGINPKLAEFSLNFALQDDQRFDEVGPAGEVLWCLRKLEPEGVRQVPRFLQYDRIAHDAAAMDDAMRQLEDQLDDELSESAHAISDRQEIKEVTISLIYPHLRAGTLPLSPRTRSLFPTAYESPRVRFTLVDARSGIKMPAWIVREHGYAFGLRDWYKSHQLIPGSLVTVRPGQKAGEVIVEARTQRSSKDWIRTLMVGADGGLVFAMLKQPITAEFNDRMAIHVGDFEALDPLWETQGSFENQVVTMMRELMKVNPQGHVHAQELYAALNLIRRVPPAPLLSLLASQKRFLHVGDLHFRLNENS